MKQTKTFGLIFVLVALLCSVQSWAGSSYYKNLSITIKNPETAKGRVYLAPLVDADTAYCVVSKDPKVAKVAGNLSASVGDFKVNMFVLPADGYVLECLALPKAYASGDYRRGAIGNAMGYPLSSQEVTLDSDTITDCTKTRPENWASETPVSTWDLCSVFVPSKKATVRNTKAGAIEKAVKASRYGLFTNDLVVTGPLNRDDFRYLNELSQESGLIRLDLSRTSITAIPDSAFYKSGLYELKLPSTIKSIGHGAFAKSMGLKPVNIPKGVTKGDDIISGCLLMELFGVKDTTESSGIDPLSFWYLFGF